MIVLCDRDIASPWGTVRAGGTIDVPAEIAAIWIDAGVARADVPAVVEERAQSEPETVTVRPRENAVKPQAQPRGRAHETRG